MRQNQYQDIVFRATAFIKANACKNLSIPDIAKHAGYSERHLRNAFKAILNQSVVSILQAEKIRKARTFLLETKLDISNIALECGFENHTSFTKAFREKVGFTPSDFRKRAAGLSEMPESRTNEPDGELETQEELYRDSFPGTNLGPDWQAFKGEWRNKNGTLIGTGASIRVDFLKPLPENCRISFEAFIEPIPNLSMSDLEVSLMNEEREYEYSSFTVASGNKPAGELRHYREGRKWNRDARVNERVWHSFTLEIRDDTLRFLIDEKEAFSFRDSFQPAYSSRCYLYLGSWHCYLHLRKFALQNLGFMPVNHPIRQGDALYNAGLPEKAMDFYLRLLKSGSCSDAETMELRYKIGMCALRQKSFSNAQNWIDKVVALREEKFWAEQAQAALLELYWKKGDLESFREHLPLCIKGPKTRDTARVTVQLAVGDLSLRGFVEDAILILDTWFSVEGEDDLARETIHRLLSEYLLRARRFAQAEKVLFDILGQSRQTEGRLRTMIDLMHLYYEWGKFSQSVHTRKEIEQSTKDPSELARCRLHEAMVFRAQGEFESALDLLQSMAGLEVEGSFLLHTKTQASCLLCYLGRLAEARKLFEEYRIAHPYQYLGSREYLPLLLAEGNFLEAERILMLEYHDNFVNCILAEAGTKAAILRELAGQVDEAKSLFEEISRRFPGEQVCFFGPFAAALLSGEDFDVGEMPYEHTRRSEMFYLCGLLKEKRGDHAAAKVLFEMSIKDDPTLRWPAYFSKKKLGLV